MANMRKYTVSYSHGAVRDGIEKAPRRLPLRFFFSIANPTSTIDRPSLAYTIFAGSTKRSYASSLINPLSNAASFNVISLSCAVWAIFDAAS